MTTPDNSYIVTVWVDAPEDWDAERVREETDEMFRIAQMEGEKHTVPHLSLNTVYTPKLDDPEVGVERNAR